MSTKLGWFKPHITIASKLVFGRKIGHYWVCNFRGYTVTGPTPRLAYIYCMKQIKYTEDYLKSLQQRSY